MRSFIGPCRDISFFITFSPLQANRVGIWYHVTSAKIMPAGISVDKEVCLIMHHSSPKTWVSENCPRIFLLYNGQMISTRIKWAQKGLTSWLSGVGDGFTFQHSRVTTHSPGGLTSHISQHLQIHQLLNKWETRAPDPSCCSSISVVSCCPGCRAEQQFALESSLWLWVKVMSRAVVADGWRGYRYSDCLPAKHKYILSLTLPLQDTLTALRIILRCCGTDFRRTRSQPIVLFY